MIAFLLTLHLLGQLDIGVELGKPERCIASKFAYRGDRWAGGRARGFSPPRRVRPDDVVVAHRTRPLRQFVIVRNRRTGLSALSWIADRGPYWRVPADGGPSYNGVGELRSRTLRPGRWRNCADVSPGLADMIGHDGMDPVEIRSVRVVFRLREAAVAAQGPGPWSAAMAAAGGGR